MTEIWRDIKDYEGLYQISNLGKVKSLINNIILQPLIKGKGYFRVILHKNNEIRNYVIHRLVAETFPDFVDWSDGAKGKSFEELQVHHKDGKKYNNCSDNLMWCTSKEHSRYGNHIENCTKWLKGHTVSNETKEKLSKAHTNHPDKSKPVEQYTKDMVFVAEYPSTKEAERQTGINNAHINAVCKHKPHYHTAGGYIWKFKE